MTEDIIKKVRLLRRYGGVHHDDIENGWFDFDEEKAAAIVSDLIAHVNELRDIALAALEAQLSSNTLQLETQTTTTDRAEALADLERLFANKNPYFNVAHYLQARFLSRHKDTIRAALTSAQLLGNSDELNKDKVEVLAALDDLWGALTGMDRREYGAQYGTIRDYITSSPVATDRAEALAVFDNCIRLAKPTECRDTVVLDCFPLALANIIRAALASAPVTTTTDRAEVFDIRRHAGNPKLINIRGLKIVAMPECEGGGYAMTGDVAERICAALTSAPSVPPVKGE